MRFLLAFSILVSLIATAAPKTIFVSIAPLVEPVQAIAGSDFIVRQVVPTGSSPETYQPAPRVLAALGKSEMLFTIGVPFETAFLPKLRASFPNLPIIDGTQGLAFRTFDDGKRDPHVWLSASNMLCFAETVAAVLATRDGTRAPQYQQRLVEYKALLQGTSDRCRVLLESLSGKSVLVYHPAFGYFLGEYGIGQNAIEEEGKEPSGSELKATLDEARAAAYPAIFVQPQFSPRSAQTLAEELSCQVIRLDPLPMKLSTGLETIAAAIARAYQRESK